MTQGLCKSFLLELIEGVHNLSADQLKLALYLPAAALDPDVVTAYVAGNEVAGPGYVAGGYVLALTGGYPLLSPTSRKVLFDFADLLVNPATFNPRYGLIYNAAKANRAISVIDFGQQYFAANSLSIIWPAPTDSGAIIRLGA